MNVNQLRKKFQLRSNLDNTYNLFYGIIHIIYFKYINIYSRYMYQFILILLQVRK